MMSHKQLKAIRRHKNIQRKRNIRTNNMAVTPMLYAPGASRSYRLYHI